MKTKGNQNRMKSHSRSRRNRPARNSHIIRLIQVITFFWIIAGLLTVAVTGLNALKELKVPYPIRITIYGLTLLLVIFLVTVITRHLLPGLKKSIKSHLSNRFYKYTVWVSSILTGLMLILFVNETYLRFFSTPVYQDAQYLASQWWNHLDLDIFNKEGRSSSQHEYQRVDGSMAIQSHIYSTEGRYERTVRWHPVIAAAEARYHIQPCLLAGLIMQESMGNPLQVNSINDGGAGLMMFQPGTAHQYGLKTYGLSRKTGSDYDHGLAVAGLLKTNNYDYLTISKLDERFDVEKSIDSGARFLRDLYAQYGSWEKAISAYNRGTPALIPDNTIHVRQVKTFQRYYCQHLPG